MAGRSLAQEEHLWRDPRGLVLALAGLPLLGLAAFGLFGPAGGFGFALALPLVMALRLARGRPPRKKGHDRQTDPLTGLPSRAALVDAMDQSLRTPGARNLTAACLVIDLDDFHGFNDLWGRSVADRFLQSSAARLAAMLRGDDLVCRLEADAFAVFLPPAPRLTLDSILALAERLQHCLADPVSVDGRRAYASASVGIALSRHVTGPDRDGGARLLAAAERAMVEARANGPSSCRLYSPDLNIDLQAQGALCEDVSAALEDGQITAWFQPQVSADGRRVTGLEALARWHHPTRGLVPPGHFLPAISAAGRDERLSEVMLDAALAALRRFDQAGLHVPTMGVNFGMRELQAVSLVPRVKASLARHDLTPDRLTIEVLESVVCRNEDDILLRNIRALTALGCRIDLDDFGTGQAAIGSIRRFGVGRIKIDRSFVTHLDRDPEQARTVQAMLGLARDLQVEALAEGVETLGEQSTLLRMGCAHVQGFGIARPMPEADTLAWLLDQQHKASQNRVQATDRAAWPSAMPHPRMPPRVASSSDTDAASLAHHKAADPPRDPGVGPNPTAGAHPDPGPQTPAHRPPEAGFAARARRPLN